MILLEDLDKDGLAEYELYWVPVTKLQSDEAYVEGDEDRYVLCYLGEYMIDPVQKGRIERAIEHGSSHEEIVCLLYECTDQLLYPDQYDQAFRGGHPIKWVITQLGGLLIYTGLAINLREYMIICEHGLRGKGYQDQGQVV
jgi:hypothetical protein